MSKQEYVSNVKFIDQSQQIVYNYLSNFENLSQYLGADMLASLNEKIPQLKVSDVESDQDSFRFKIGGMQAMVRIAEREPDKLIKFSGEGQIPVAGTMWIQLLPVSPYRTKLRLTLHAEMNAMIKMMFHKQLEQGIDQIAELLTRLPYR